MAKQDAGDAGRRRNESVYHRHGGRYGRVKGRRQPRHERPERLLAASQDERARQRGDQVGDEHPRRDAAHRVDGRRTRQGEVACVVSAPGIPAVVTPITGAVRASKATCSPSRVTAKTPARQEWEPDAPSGHGNGKQRERNSHHREPHQRRGVAPRPDVRGDGQDESDQGDASRPGDPEHPARWCGHQA